MVELLLLANLAALAIVAYFVRSLHKRVTHEDAALQEVHGPLRQIRRLIKELKTEERGREISDHSLWPQIEALLALNRLIGDQDPLPPLRRWAMSPDLLVHLYRHIRSRDARIIIECGSGASTIVMATVLSRAGNGGRVYAIEDNPRLARELRDDLARRNLSEYATVIDAPLTERQYPGFSHVFNWYSLAPDVLPANADLLVVDGPPGKVNKLARYPALPEMLSRLSPHAHIILDDAARPDEQALAKHWRALYPDLGVRELKLEKGAFEMYFLDQRAKQFSPDFESKDAESEDTASKDAA